MFSFSSRAAIVAALFAVPGIALAAKPAAPAVTVGAGLKQLRFDFAPVPEASYYQLWFRANGGTPWVKYWEKLASDPGFAITVSAHLLDWTNARYYVTACNSSGCSRTSDIYVTSLMKETVGYFKPAAGVVGAHYFGASPALSADGTAYAVIGGETRGTHKNSITVTVYRKQGSSWRQEVRLGAYPAEEETARWGYIRNLAINADGTVIALGVPNQYDPASPGSKQNGQVFVFRRTGTTWKHEQSFFPPRNGLLYGERLDLDDAGETLAILQSYGEGWVTLGVVEVWKHGSSGWALQTTVPKTPIQEACNGFAMSGDGRVVVRDCIGANRSFGEVYELQGADYVLRDTFERGDDEFNRHVDVNRDGSLIAALTQGTVPEGAEWHRWVTVFRRAGNAWLADPAFTHVGGTAENPPTNSCCDALAISPDGRFVAMGSVSDSNAGSGVVRPPLSRTAPYTGAVYVYERKPDTWRLRNMIKANNPSYNQGFGHGLAFSGDGKILAIGAPEEDSGARGIDGDQASTSSTDSGAGWLY